MAVVTTDRPVTKRGLLEGLSAGPVKAGIILPHGRPVFVDEPTGFLTNTSNAGANKFVGWCHERVDNSGGADGDKNCEYHIRDRFTYPFDAINQASVGKSVYAIDNDQLTMTAAGATLVGTLTEYISPTEGEVDIDFQA